MTNITCSNSLVEANISDHRSRERDKGHYSAESVQDREETKKVDHESKAQLEGNYSDGLKHNR